MKKKVFIALFIITVFVSGIFVDKLLFSNKDVDDGFNDLSQVKHENMLSMMLEQNVGSGDYELETRSSWPTETDGYVFNETLSKCENGSKLSWDDELKAIKFHGSTTDKCYIYFDKIPTLTEWIVAQYTGTQGENNIYYHNETILSSGGKVLDAGDNSYRYAGSNDTTNNFLCFGTDNETCSDDNLYRIIGVFEEQVKLVKYDYATSDLLGTDGAYDSNNEFSIKTKSNNSPDWETSELYLINLNTNFINNIGTRWSNLIAKTSWQVNTVNDLGKWLYDVYDNEILNPEESKVVNNKIGLIYLSDYSYSFEVSTWNEPYDEISEHSKQSWLTIDNGWLISKKTQKRCWLLSDNDFESGHISDCYYVYPSFYLNKKIIYDSGTGTKTDPIRIKLD